MKKYLFLTFILTLFVFMNNVNASDMICTVNNNEYDPQRAFLTIYESDGNDENYASPDEVLLRTYNDALERFITDYNWGNYIVSLSVSEGEHAPDFAFTFKRFYGILGNASYLAYQVGVWRTYTYTLSDDNIYVFSSVKGPSSTEYWYDKYVEFVGSGCTVNPLKLFAGNANINWERSDVLVPVYHGQYTHQALGSSAPYAAETWIPEIYSSSFTTLSLNASPYLVLSLPSYDVEPFETKIFAKGQFCFTPVYNYGTEEKATPSSNGCYVYDDYTAITISVSQEDLDNHVVFYVSNYDGNTESYIKLNPTVFDYKFIYDTDNPTLTFDGTTYNIIPYGNLTTTAITNTTDGVIPGASCQLGDLACTAENDPNVSGFDNLIDNILDFGSSIWSSVVNFMSLVTKLITVLPPDFQQVILICFTFGLIIGVVKIFIK